MVGWEKEVRYRNCDDNDPLSQLVSLMHTCDGILTEYDCDDNNSLDNDCDGVAMKMTVMTVVVHNKGRGQ